MLAQIKATFRQANVRRLYIGDFSFYYHFYFTFYLQKKSFSIFYLLSSIFYL